LVARVQWVSTTGYYRDKKLRGVFVRFRALCIGKVTCTRASFELRLNGVVCDSWE
jgi:hypothetical protein